MKENTALGKLLEMWDQMIDEAAERMTPEEFKKAAEESNAALQRGIDRLRKPATEPTKSLAREGE